MKEEKELELVKNYPSVLEKYGEKMGGLTRFWCDDGWYNLVDQYCQQCAFISESFGYDVKITQIKEKFGLLRIYFDFKSGEPYSRKEKIVREILQACALRIEELSKNVCEVTGSSAGTLCRWRDRYKTLCYDATRGSVRYRNYDPVSNSVCEYWYELDKQKLNG